MAILEILHYPDPRLRDQAKPIANIDRDLETFIGDLFQTMYEAPGVGLAATQVGVAKRVAVMDCSEDKNEPIVMINPEILETGELIDVDEGCLSVPDHYDSLQRFDWVKFSALDGQGERYEIRAEGLLAQCVQHEIGHLDGELYIDKLSRLKRERIRRKLVKAQRQASKA